MFKAKINHQRTIPIENLYFNKAIFWIVIILYIILFSKVDGAFLSMDSLLQKATQIWVSNNINNIEGNDQRDIFERILWETNSAWWTSIKETLQGISSQIKANATSTCSISDSDINIILWQSPWLLLDFYKYNNIPSSTVITTTSNTNKEDLRNSCTKLLRCYWQIKQDNQINDIRWLENCKTIIQNIYYVNSDIYTTNNNISSLNKNDNIYMDGIEDNWLFDLMLDIENTKKILFSKDDGPSLPQMIYYSLPSINTSANTINNNQNNIPGWISWIGWGNSSVSNWNTATNQTTSWSQENGLPKNTVTSSINNFISEIENTTTNTTTNWTISNQQNDNTIQAEICLPGDNSSTTIVEETSTWDNNNLESQENIINNFNLIQEQLLNYTSWYLFSATNTNQIWWNNGYNSNIIQTNWALPSTTQQCQNSCSNTEGTEKLICEWKCCLQSCEQVSNPSDKAICLSQCLCWETSIANDILRIKICRVPAQPARVLAGKKISSIQEAVDEINEIFNKLKQNWLLIKRTKKKEMLDSSYSNVKFNEILAFDIFMAIKPIYDKLQLSQAKEDSKNQNQSSELIKWFEEKPLQWADRNKYVTLTEKTWLSKIQECTARWQAYDTDTNKCISEYNKQKFLMLESLSKWYTKSIINDTFSTFFKEHYQLREQIDKKIWELTTITTALRTKAENAK